MGANGSTALQVKFSRPSLMFFAGEQVSGNITFQNTQEKITLDGIFLEYVGEMGYTTQETRYIIDKNGHRRPENYVENHSTPFVTIRIPVAQPQYGQVNE